MVDVPFTDGIRQVEYMRLQERCRLVRVRYFSAAAGRKKLGTGAEGDADHHYEPVSYTHLDVYKRQDGNRFHDARCK